MLVFALFTAGCGTKQAQDTKAPGPQVGIIDMNKAIKSHPKYNQLMVLGQQADTLAAQLEAQQLANQQSAATQGGSIPDMSQNQMAELNKAFEQEFNAKMSAKQEELNPKITAKADTIRRLLSDEMNAYNDQLDKEYQPQIFNLQLKLKTVQLAKEEAAVLQAELEKIQTQRSEALAAKQAQLAARMDELLAPEKAAVEQQLAAYAKQLNEEISKQAAAKQAEIVARNNEQQIPAAQVEQAPSQIQEQLAMKHQEIQALQGYIIANITEKTAKVAAESGFEAVLTNVAVNISAVDITTQVIAECNK
ncbi:MAG: outer rane chaperone Skp (OmpH) [Firmicutes bacterium]|nr:outer rane chaperone Skp (OmpH) [Bacillota bacterium]